MYECVSGPAEVEEVRAEYLGDKEEQEVGLEVSGNVEGPAREGQEEV